MGAIAAGTTTTRRVDFDVCSRIRSKNQVGMYNIEQSKSAFVVPLSATIPHDELSHGTTGPICQRSPYEDLP